MISRRLRLAATVAPLLLSFHAPVHASGVTPYLPLNLEPEIESQIERVLILGDQSVLTRPIAAATVLKALPKACQIDEALCHRVQRYLARYTHNSGLTHASIEGAGSSGANDKDPNRYGMSTKSTWQASANAYIQPGDHFLISLGGVAYEGKTDFTGTMISVGGSYAQLDLGFRPHWLSPFTDSSMLMSTEAPTMPSVTLSNYEPFTPLGIRYELFDARMSNSDRIAFQNAAGEITYKSGKPLLAGIHLSVEPVSGWSFGVSRLLQYGGAGRPESLKDLARAFFNPSRYDNTNPDLSFNQQFGNEQASFTSSFLFPGRVPFAVYAEYAGEDTSRGRSYLLGNSALSLGIHFPRLWERFDLTFETSEWQNDWYIHGVYQDGMTNYGSVTGNWGADQRVFGDSIGARSDMVRLGWNATFGGLLELKYRTLQNENYGSNHYDRYHDFTLGYSRPWQGVIVGGEIDAGRDSFGASFTRIAGFIRYDDLSSGLGTSMLGAISSMGEKAGDIFVDAGVNSVQIRTDLTDGDMRITGPRKTGSHFAVGARRAVSEHNDLGARVELDDVDGHSLIGFRLIDYRYRFNGPIAVGAFLGAARWALGTPAYGIYYGVGAQWRDVIPGFDIGIDYRINNSVARDHLLPNDPISPRPDSFYDITGEVVSISYHF